ncbi:MAG: helix-turn-helix domain-containing protein [Clostridia bacterium]|nr:helix-turn-helix domain-containing protein [Clostridia bacterium]
MRIYEKNTHFVNKEGVLIKKYISNITTHRHSHDFLEIVYILQGSGIHEIGDTTYTMFPGCLYIVDSGEVHNLHFHETSEYYNLFLKEDFLQEITLSLDGAEVDALSFLRGRKNSEPFVRFSAEKNRLIQELFGQCYFELHKAEAPERALVRHYLSLLLLEYASALRQIDHTREPDVILPRAIDYINRHYKEPLSIDEIARRYNYNPVYFGRLFQKYYGCPIKSYISDLRLTFAGELLETTSYSIDEIVLQAGFGNKLQFYKKFKERFGCTPKEYKTSLLQKDNRLALEAPQTDALSLSRFHWSATSDAGEKLYELTAEDDSMLLAGIFPGDTILFHRKSSAENGDLVIIATEEGKLLARQLYTLGTERQYILHACTDENKKYPDVYLDSPKILGRIVKILHDPKNSRIFL